jgi:hypothetical protein
MSPELTEKLLKKYPKIFHYVENPIKGPQLPITLFMIECGSGWYNIIDVLCANIQHSIDWSEKAYKIDTGYNDMLKQVLSGNRKAYDEYFTTSITDEKKREEYFKLWLKTAKMREVKEPIPQVIAVQVKEKFGTLRFYVDGGNEATYAMISMAESMSARTCEKCGAPGKLRGKTWLYTACDEHTEECDKFDDGEEDGE